MNILVLADNLKYGGALTVLRNTLEYLIEINGKERVYTVVNNTKVLNDLVKNIKIDKEKCLVSGADNILKVNRNRHSNSFKSWINNKNIDITYNLTNLPYGFTKEVLLIHNALLIYRNKQNKKLLRYLLRRYYLKYSLNKVERIIVQTNFMKELLVNELKVRAKKIVVIPSGVQSISHSSHKRESVKSNRHVNIMVVAKDYPHKNLSIIPEAIKQVNQKLDTQEFTINFYMNDEEYRNSQLFSNIKSLGLTKIMVNKGEVDWGTIIKEYEKNDCLLLPTKVESFCLPYVEAMSRGCGILTSNKKFSTEICGNAALYFDEESSKDIAEKIVMYLKSRELRERLTHESIERYSKHFIDWEKSINLVYNVLKET